MRGQSPITSLSSWLFGGVRFINRRRKESLTVLLAEQTHRQLRERAVEAATAQGLTTTDFAYGFFLPDHMSSNLEAAYLAEEARSSALATNDEDLSLEEDDEMVFVSFALSSALVRKLLAQARRDAYGQGITADLDLETFVYRRLGQLLEVAYYRHA